MRSKNTLTKIGSRGGVLLIKGGSLMISVIVPIYNTKSYLSKCLDSIINQSYKNIEVILVDDGSTDGSSQIAKKYMEKDGRIKLIDQQNAGQGSARNTALRKCKGDYISFIDSDDYIRYDMFEILVKKMNECDADLAICGIVRDHGFFSRNIPTLNKVTLFSNADLMKAYLSTPYITTSSCNKLYRRILWKDLRFPEIRAREDVSILHEVISKADRAIYVPDGLYFQYVRLGSTERKKFSKEKLASIQASQDIITFVSNRYENLLPYSFLRSAETYANLMGEIISTFQYFKQKQLYKKLYEDLYNELNSKKDFAHWNYPKYTSLNKILNYPELFHIKHFYRGLARLIVDLFKGMMFKLLTLRQNKR
jgi:glycosyltransferase involved in cell wall biosynthesis